jgi:hypothetical protein
LVRGVVAHRPPPQKNFFVEWSSVFSTLGKELLCRVLFSDTRQRVSLPSIFFDSRQIASLPSVFSTDKNNL